MMYPYMTLDDNTEITYSELKPNGKICVYVETPNKNGGFNNAICLLPENKWSDIKGYSDREMDFYKRLVRNNTNFIIASAQKEAVLEGRYLSVLALRNIGKRRRSLLLMQ